MITINRPAREATLRAVVTRADGRVEDHGVIAYWHKNPLRRWLWLLLHPKQIWHSIKQQRKVLP